MSSVNGDGGYVTRGRAGEIERMLAELEGRVMARIDDLERQLAEARAFPLDVARAQIEGTLHTLRRYSGVRGSRRGGEGG